MKEKVKLIVFGKVLITLIACKTQQTMLPAVVTESVSPPQTEVATERSDSLAHKKLDYNWISYRANLSVSMDNLNNLNLFVVNRKDSIIYITVSKMGIEGMRLVLTPDSVKFLNHLSSSYYVGGYSVSKTVGQQVDFYMIQSLLTGEEPSPKTSLQAKYGNFTAIDSQLFFQQADFIVSKDLQINVVVKNIKLNAEGPTSIRIPEKYTPIKMSE